ncbi:L-rhamnonate dehydratase [Stieleria maiorica]|uniref:L-rhamnonate dehydratase n=1 Tax=Stieleria maiorica TaxID=2795974 RepID=A0A5B9MBE5_9BACT|nr:mandelate racemase/muconate lactonizing enzyme family protein [Stieleria maiorica]QEF96884.1 L-rhamnonate dehydratase [Stieleria maiorica]
MSTHFRVPDRRQFLKTGLLASLTTLPHVADAVDIPGREPMLNLKQRFRSPIIIASVDQLRVGDSIWFRVRSDDGLEGYCPGNDRLEVTVEMAKQLVVPFFVGKDARDIESLVDDVYTERDSRGSVYKFAGMPFWNVVGHIEVALFDMLARQARVPVNTLLGRPLRAQIPVYISQFGRATTARQEVENAARDLEKTSALATKLKVGRRMANSEQQMQRDRRMIELARKTFGDDVTIYVDANSSYTVAEAIQMGRFLDDYGVAFFEEPVPWQDYRGTRKVAEALRELQIEVAGGEQDSSLWQWDDMIDGRTVDVVQPDVFYNGGFVRTLRVAKMAEAVGIPVTPHSPKVLPHAAANLHLCSVLPNLGPFQEYRSYGKVTDGKVTVPTGVGLGIEIDTQNITNANLL